MTLTTIRLCDILQVMDTSASELYKKQMAHVLAEEEVDDDGCITIYALGGFVPDDDEEQARLFLQASPPYKRGAKTFGGPLAAARAENQYRLFTILRMNDFLRVLRETGCNISRAAKISGLNRTFATQLRIRVPAFANAWQEAFDEVTDKLEQEGLRRAVDGVDEPVFYQGIECGTKRVYSDSLLSMMLQGRRPDIYKNRVAQEVSGPNGGPVEFQTMSDDQLDAFIATKLAECQIKGLVPRETEGAD